MAGSVGKVRLDLGNMNTSPTMDMDYFFKRIYNLIHSPDPVSIQPRGHHLPTPFHSWSTPSLLPTLNAGDQETDGSRDLPRALLKAQQRRPPPRSIPYPVIAQTAQSSKPGLPCPHNIERSRRPQNTKRKAPRTEKTEKGSRPLLYNQKKLSRLRTAPEALPLPSRGTRGPLGNVVCKPPSPRRSNGCQGRSSPAPFAVRRGPRGSSASPPCRASHAPSRPPGCPFCGAG